LVRAARSAVILSHLVLAALLALAITQIWKIPAQLNSGYVPPDYWMFVAMVAIPLVLAGFILLTLIPWVRGSRRWLIATDLTVTLAAWPILVLLVVDSDLPVMSLGLAPLALALAVIAPRDRAVPTEERPV
jgi:hypothetical protein